MCNYYAPCFYRIGFVVIPSYIELPWLKQCLKEFIYEYILAFAGWWSIFWEMVGGGGYILTGGWWWWTYFGWWWAVVGGGYILDGGGWWWVWVRGAIV